jgi:hypothetical protein
MSPAGYVMVYRYRYWDEDREQHIESKWEATLECINSGLGTAIVESGRQVPRTSLDQSGRMITPELSGATGPLSGR